MRGRVVVQRELIESELECLVVVDERRGDVSVLVAVAAVAGAGLRAGLGPR